jgi:hypothetical protein
MAMGGNSGYLTVNPTQDYIGQAARGVENGIAQVRAKIPKKEINYLMIGRTATKEEAILRILRSLVLNTHLYSHWNNNLDSWNR